MTLNFCITFFRQKVHKLLKFQDSLIHKVVNISEISVLFPASFSFVERWQRLWKYGPKFNEWLVIKMKETHSQI
jgi:hypothetical protein